MRYEKDNMRFISMIITLVLFLLFLATTGFAQSPGTWELGLEVANIQYEEPGFMEEDGPMSGVCVSYTSPRKDNTSMLRIEGRYAVAQMDYTSNGSGTMDGIDDYLYELRGLFGRDFRLKSGAVLTPYVGLGYRYLNDDSSGKTTSTGHGGYEREANYFYSPIGIEVMRDSGKVWSWGLMVEYDIFWYGVQKSHLSDVGPGYEDAENDQDSGYGIRGSIKLLRKGKNLNLLIEPYVRYWDIDQSDTTTISVSGSSVGIIEPANNSTEIGLKIAMTF